MASALSRYPSRSLKARQEIRPLSLTIGRGCVNLEEPIYADQESKCSRSLLLV